MDQLKSAFLEVVAINESLEKQVEDLNDKLKTRDLVIEAQSKAILELASKIDELTGGALLQDSDDSQPEETSKQVNPFYKGQNTEISKIEEEAHDESSNSKLSLSNENQDDSGSVKEK